MHELSLAESMRDLIEEHASSEQFSKVTRVVLEVGELSHACADAMRFCFDAVIAGSIAEQASLEIESSSGRGRCSHCQHVNGMTQLYDPCPDCGEFGMTVISGDQVRIRRLEVI